MDEKLLTKRKDFFCKGGELGLIRLYDWNSTEMGTRVNHREQNVILLYLIRTNYGAVKVTSRFTTAVIVNTEHDCVLT